MNNLKLYMIILKKLGIIMYATIVLHADSCIYNIYTEKDIKRINVNNCSYMTINIAMGEFTLKQPLEIDSKKTNGIIIRGKGIRNTKLLVRNKKGGLKINLYNRSTTVQIENLSIYSRFPASESAIKIFQTFGGNQHRRNVILRDLEISNFKNINDFYFIDAISLYGVWRPLIDNVFISGFYGPHFNSKKILMHSCFLLNEVYSPTINNTRCWSSKIGVNIISSKNPGPEGLMISNSKFVETLVGINIDFVSQEPGGFITNNHINSIKAGINIKNRKFFIIKNNLMYMNKNSKEYIDINLSNVDSSIVSDNIFHYPNKDKPNKRIEINLVNSRNNKVDENLNTR